MKHRQPVASPLGSDYQLQCGCEQRTWTTMERGMKARTCVSKKFHLAFTAYFFLMQKNANTNAAWHFGAVSLRKWLHLSFPCVLWPGCNHHGLHSTLSTAQKVAEAKLDEPLNVSPHDPCCSHCPVPTLLVVTLCVTLADQASYT